jgi:Fe-S cluster assembly protein SufB
MNEYPILSKILRFCYSIGDNYFAALNSATDGSFVYIPENTICPLDLSTYFRINDPKSGQFENIGEK